MDPDPRRTIEKRHLDILGPDRSGSGRPQARSPQPNPLPSVLPALTRDPAATLSRREFRLEGGLAGARTGGLILRLHVRADAVLSRIRHPRGLDIRVAGPLRQYLRQAILDCLEQSALRPIGAVDADGLRRYRWACTQLPQSDRELIVARVELGYSYEQMAMATDRSSAHAARSAVRRALLRLTEVMGRA